MSAIKFASLAVAVIALVMTFKANFIVEKIFKKEPSERLVLRVKYIALALSVLAFLTVFIIGR